LPGYAPGLAGSASASSASSASGGRALRLLALTAVSLGVLVLAAGAGLLSYPGLHAIALQAGVSARLARVYPAILDAMLVIAAAAVLSLRGAGLFSRLYAWLSLLVMLAAAAGADAVHSTGTRLSHRPAAAAAAIVPWVLVLLGFSLMLTMLRQSRTQHVAAMPDEPAPQPASEAPGEEEEETAALQYLAAPEPAGWIERVADSGEPAEDADDYWDRDDALTAVPHLNRVRATPIPPEEEDDE
jgi:hypothetical protein